MKYRETSLLKSSRWLKKHAQTFLTGLVWNAAAFIPQQGVWRLSSVPKLKASKEKLALSKPTEPTLVLIGETGLPWVILGRGRGYYLNNFWTPSQWKGKWQVTGLERMLMWCWNTFHICMILLGELLLSFKSFV